MKNSNQNVKAEKMIVHILTRWYVPIQIGHAIDIRERQQFNFVPRAILKNSPSSYSEKMRWGRGCKYS